MRTKRLIRCLSVVSIAGSLFLLAALQWPRERDQDRDGVPDSVDNCPEVRNPRQHDTDRDEIGDACDNCPLRWNPNQRDRDGDGEGDRCEKPNPPRISDFIDRDFDQIPDEYDNCPD
ncbi:MAG: hypothetical protein D6795_16100, partial [Deltaproteobacteria bacterium]